MRDNRSIEEIRCEHLAKALTVCFAPLAEAIRRERMAGYSPRRERAALDRLLADIERHQPPTPGDVDGVPGELDGERWDDCG
jgi:hypothetical protein